MALVSEPRAALKRCAQVQPQGAGCAATPADSGAAASVHRHGSVCVPARGRALSWLAELRGKKDPILTGSISSSWPPPDLPELYNEFCFCLDVPEDAWEDDDEALQEEDVISEVRRKGERPLWHSRQN